MRTPFAETHEVVIPYSELIEYGWTAEQYFSYCRYCSCIRAVLIEECVNGRKADYEIQSSIDQLFHWLENAAGIWIQIDYDMVYSLRAQIRYFSDDVIEQYGLPELFRSEEDFRFALEEHICLSLSEGKPESIDFLPVCETKEKAARLYNELHAEVERILDSIEFKDNSFRTECELYSWARNTASKLAEIRELESRMTSLDVRIEELENGAEFNANVNTLYICKGVIRCERLNHQITAVTAAIPDINGKVRKLNVNYCRDCRIFFISYSE